MAKNSSVGEVAVAVGLSYLALRAADAVWKWGEKAIPQWIENERQYWRWRNFQPDEFDKAVMNNVRPSGFFKPQGRAQLKAWQLTPVEKKRIRQKMKSEARLSRQHMSFHYPASLQDRAATYWMIVSALQSRQKASARPRTIEATARVIESRPGEEVKQLTAAPPVEATPVEASERVKRTKRHGQSGRITRIVRTRLKTYARLRIESGLAHRPALAAAAKEHAESEGANEDRMCRSIRDAVRIRLDNGRDVGKLRRFFDDHSKHVGDSKGVKKRRK